MQCEGQGEPEQRMEAAIENPDRVYLWIDLGIIATGTDHPPPLGFPNAPDIQFQTEAFAICFNMWPYSISTTGPSRPGPIQGDDGLYHNLLCSTCVLCIIHMHTCMTLSDSVMHF